MSSTPTSPGSSDRIHVVQPAHFPRPMGYANGMVARGRTLYVAGQVGWNAQEQFESDDLVDQVRQALRNVVAVLAEAGATPAHIVRMTWYLLDRQDYKARSADIGRAYRDVMGRQFGIAMTAVQVAGFVEAGALVEIEVTAVMPDA